MPLVEAGPCKYRVRVVVYFSKVEVQSGPIRRRDPTMEREKKKFGLDRLVLRWPMFYPWGA